MNSGDFRVNAKAAQFSIENGADGGRVTGKVAWMSQYQVMSQCHMSPDELPFGQGVRI